MSPYLVFYCPNFLGPEKPSPAIQGSAMLHWTAGPGQNLLSSQGTEAASRVIDPERWGRVEREMRMRRNCDTTWSHEYSRHIGCDLLKNSTYTMPLSFHLSQLYISHCAMCPKILPRKEGGEHHRISSQVSRLFLFRQPSTVCLTCWCNISKDSSCSCMFFPIFLSVSPRATLRSLAP